MSTYQSGVIACHSITTTRPEAIHPKSSTLKAWPGIKEWNRYCVLPTVGALYRPDVLLNPTDVASVSLPPGWTLKKIMEEVIRWFPTPEQFMSEVMPMFEEYLQTVAEYYQSHFGIEFDKQYIQQYLANVLASPDEHHAIKYSPDTETTKLFQATNKIEVELDSKEYLSSMTELLTKMLSPEDTFSTGHEAGHFVSFALLRPAITQFKATWSEIEDLLQQAATGVHNGFWVRFTDLNSKLKDCLSNSLELEELRANLFVLEAISKSDDLI
jgi:hypothetical protein